MLKFVATKVRCCTTVLYDELRFSSSLFVPALNLMAAWKVANSIF